MRIFTTYIKKGEVISKTFTASTKSVTLKLKSGTHILHTNNLASGLTGSALYSSPATENDFSITPTKDGISLLTPSRQFNTIKYEEIGITRVDLYCPVGSGQVEITVI